MGKQKYLCVILLVNIYLQHAKSSIIVSLLKQRKILPATKDSISDEAEDRVKNGFLTALANVATRKGLQTTVANKYGEVPYRDTIRNLLNSLDQHRIESDERVQEVVEEVLSQNWDLYFGLLANSSNNVTMEEYYEYHDSTKNLRNLQDSSYSYSDEEPEESTSSISLLWIVPVLIIIALLGVTYFFASRKTVTTMVPRMVKPQIPRTPLNEDTISQTELV